VILALMLLSLRQGVAAGGGTDRVDLLLPAVRAGLESTLANVGPELALRGLWARVGRVISGAG